MTWFKGYMIPFLLGATSLQFGDCMLFDISPRAGVESLTPKVVFGCRTDIDAPSSKPKEIVLIQITKGEHTPVAMFRPNGGISYADGQPRKLEGVGDIDNMVIKGGYLNLTMHFPSHEDSGIYKCHVVYLDDVGVASYYSNDAYLDIDKPSLTRTDQKVKSLEANVQQLNDQLKELTTAAVKKDDLASCYFSASVSHETYVITDHMNVVFDDIITQGGQGYNPQTGVFTAPADGLYSLSLSLAIEGIGLSVGFSLETSEGQILSKLYVEGKAMGDQSTVSTVANLRSGGQVMVKVVYKTKPSGRIYNDRYSVFSGSLIKLL